MRSNQHNDIVVFFFVLSAGITTSSNFVFLFNLVVVVVICLIAIMVMITLCFALIPGGNIRGAFTADALAQTFQATAATALILRAYRAMRRGDAAATDGATS